MPPTPPPLPPPPPDTRSGERTLVVLAIIAGLLLTFAAYSPRFTSKPPDYRPGELAAYRVDLNRADRSELMQVPGLGPGKADAIVAHRNAVGSFGSVNDLSGVKGIGPKTIDQIQSHVIVDGSTVLPQTPPISNNIAQPKLKPGDPPLDLNSATESDLQRLPGVGPTLSGRIVAAKPFASIDDLRRVKGIGAKTLENLRPFVVVK